MKIRRVGNNTNVGVKSSTDTKVLKAPVKACDELTVPACKYDSAICFIQSAIESLAEIAKDDQIAKDSIANLGVVMLDLKGGC